MAHFLILNVLGAPPKATWGTRERHAITKQNFTFSLPFLYLFFTDFLFPDG